MLATTQCQMPNSMFLWSSWNKIKSVTCSSIMYVLDSCPQYIFQKINSLLKVSAKLPMTYCWLQLSNDQHLNEQLDFTVAEKWAGRIIGLRWNHLCFLLHACTLWCKMAASPPQASHGMMKCLFYTHQSHWMTSFYCLPLCVGFALELIC